ncbi:MAG: hypothetical protein G01um101425_260 [Candidatus Peregrinibacteria bacterium Gr01-1014_25]|nr:MAG: hypothetical protein G01um101425_260 [Candidatus Peregrinibacteria bacterium Gr01-1014_25]
MHEERDQGSFVGRWYGLLIVEAAFFGVMLLPLLFSTSYRFGQFDAATQLYPDLHLLKQRLFSTDALWNDMNFHGYPTLLLYGLAFQPVLSLFMLAMPAALASHWALFAHLVLGALFASLTLRQYRLSALASLSGGILYSLALWTWLSDISISFFLPLFSLLTLIFAYWQRRPSGGDGRLISFENIGLFVVGTAVMAFAWLGLLFHYSALLCAGLSLFVIAQCAVLWRGGNKALARRLLIAFCAVVVLGFVIGLLRVLPAWAYGLLSTRTEAVTFERVQHMAIGPLYTWQFIMPETSAPFLKGAGEIDPYLGPFAIIFALTALVRHWRRPLTWYCLGIAAFVLLIAVPSSPVRTLVYELPFMRYLGSPTRWLFLGTLALLPFTAIGFDAIVRDAAPSKAQRYISYAFLVIGALLLAGALAATTMPFLFASFQGKFSQSFDVRFLSFVQSLPQSSQHLLLAEQAHIKAFVTHLLQSTTASLKLVYGIDSPRLLFPLLHLLLAGILLAPRVWTRIPVARRAATLAAVSLGGLLLTFTSMTVRGTTNTWFLSPPLTALHLQQSLKDGGTFLPFLTQENYPYAFRGNADTVRLEREYQEAVLRPNINLLWGISSADYIDPLAAKRMTRLIAAIGAETIRLPSEEVLAHAAIPFAEKIQTLRQRRHLLDILNIQQIVSVLRLEQVGLTKSFALDLPSMTTPITVYRNDRALPFAYFARSVESMPLDPDLSYRRLLDERWSRDRVLLECPGCTGKRSYSANGTVDVQTRRPTRVEIATTSNQAQRLIVSQNYTPGWNVEVDGQTVLPGLAYGVFPGIDVPPGQHRVVLTFSYAQLLRDSLRMALRSPDQVWRDTDS